MGRLLLLRSRRLGFRLCRMLLLSVRIRLVSGWEEDSILLLKRRRLTMITSMVVAVELARLEGGGGAVRLLLIARLTPVVFPSRPLLLVPPSTPNPPISTTTLPAIATAAAPIRPMEEAQFQPALLSASTSPPLPLK